MILLGWTLSPSWADPVEVDAGALVREVVLEVAPLVESWGERRFGTLPRVVVTDAVSEYPRLAARHSDTIATAIVRETAGIYSYETDEIVLFWEPLAASIDVDPSGAFTRRVLRCLIAHELTHALQARHVPRTTLESRVLAEGQANYVESRVCAADPAALAYTRFGAWDNLPGPLHVYDARFLYLWAGRTVENIHASGEQDAVWHALADPPPMTEIWLRGVPVEHEDLAAAPWHERNARGVCAAAALELEDLDAVVGAGSGPLPQTADAFALLLGARGETRFACPPYLVSVWQVDRRPGVDGWQENEGGWVLAHYDSQRRWVTIMGPEDAPRGPARQLLGAVRATRSPPPLHVALAAGPQAATALLHDEIELARIVAADRVREVSGLEVPEVPEVVIEDTVTATHQLYRRLVTEEGLPATMARRHATTSVNLPRAFQPAQGGPLVIPWQAVNRALTIDPTGTLARSWIGCAVLWGVAEASLEPPSAAAGDPMAPLTRHLVRSGYAAWVAQQACDAPEAVAFLRHWRLDLDESDFTVWSARGMLEIGLRLAEAERVRGDPSLSALLSGDPTFESVWKRAGPRLPVVQPWPDEEGQAAFCAALGGPVEAASWGDATALFDFAEWPHALTAGERTFGVLTLRCAGVEAHLWQGVDLDQAAAWYLGRASNHGRWSRFDTAEGDVVVWQARRPLPWQLLAVYGALLVDLRPVATGTGWRPGRRALSAAIEAVVTAP